MIKINGLSFTTWTGLNIYSLGQISCLKLKIKLKAKAKMAFPSLAGRMLFRVIMRLTDKLIDTLIERANDEDTGP